MRARPIVVQHSYGDLGSGGPVGALERVLASDLGARFEFVRMHQDGASGGIDWKRLTDWTDLLREVRPDLVHVRGLGNEGFHAALAAHRAGCPRVLVSVHGSVRDLVNAGGVRHMIVRDVLEPMTLRLATHVTTVCHSAAQREFIRRHSRKFVGPMTNGVDLPTLNDTARAEARRRLGIAPDDVVLVNVGRLTWEKGHRALAEALARSRADLPPEVVVLVVGEGPERAEIERAYSSTGVRYRFLGLRLDVPDILCASDVFVFPSLHENLSNALLEAMAFGLPAVASRVGGNIEVVEKGGGVLVAPDDARDLADALLSLASNPAARRRHSLAARATVEQAYSIASMTATLDSIYTTIIRS